MWILGFIEAFIPAVKEATAATEDALATPLENSTPLTNIFISSPAATPVTVIRSCWVLAAKFLDKNYKKFHFSINNYCASSVKDVVK